MMSRKNSQNNKSMGKSSINMRDDFSSVSQYTIRNRRRAAYNRQITTRKPRKNTLTKSGKSSKQDEQLFTLATEL